MVGDLLGWVVLPGQTVWQEPMWTTRFTVSELRAQSRTFHRPWQLTLQALGSDASLGKCAVACTTASQPDTTQQRQWGGSEESSACLADQLGAPSTQAATVS